MPRFWYLTAILLVPYPRLAFADQPDLGANAALKYWQAFARLPRMEHEEQKEFTARSQNMALDERARGLLKDSAYSLRLLRRAAALPQCDWGIGLEEGVGTELPHIDGAMALSTFALLSARRHFEAGQNAEGIEDVVATLTLGRHVTRGGVNVQMLVGYNVERRAGETLARYLPRLDTRSIGDLKKRLAALPPIETPAEALKYEEVFALDWFIRRVREAKGHSDLVALLSLLTDEHGRPRPDKAGPFIEACGGTAEGVIRAAEKTRAAYDDLGKKLDLPPGQFQKEFDRESAKYADNPVFREIFPAVAKVRWAQARYDIRRALLAAALDVRLRDAETLKDHPDPVAGEPFEYQPFEGGFELRSKAKLDDRGAQPVALTVGQRAK